MSNLRGIRLHAILGRILRGDIARCSTIRNSICDNDISKLDSALKSFMEQYNLCEPRVEQKLSAYGISGRCDAIFKDKHSDNVLIVDWKFVRKPSNMAKIQLNIYRQLYMAIEKKSPYIAIVFITYNSDKFTFELLPVHQIPDSTCWSLINYAKQH